MPALFPAQLWLPRGVKYTLDVPEGLVKGLSTTIPLVPAVSDKVAVVAELVLHVPLVTLNDMMQPLELLGQLTGDAVLAFPCTLRKILSVDPLRNSVTGEHWVEVKDVVSGGPPVPEFIALLTTGTCHRVGELARKGRPPHTYKLPVSFPLFQ